MTAGRHSLEMQRLSPGQLPPLGDATGLYCPSLHTPWGSVHSGPQRGSTAWLSVDHGGDQLLNSPLWLLFLPCPLLLKPSLRPHFMGSLPSYVPVSLFRICSVHAVCLVTQPSPTPCDPLDCSPPGSPVHGILQATMLEGVAIPFSRGSSQPRDQTCVSCISGIAGRFFTSEPPGNLWSVP